MCHKIQSIVFDFDGTLAELHLDFVEMKRRVALLAEEFLTPTRVSPSLPVLEWLTWLEHVIKVSRNGDAGTFRADALALIEQMEIEAAQRGALFPFTRPLLMEMLQKGKNTAIITRNCDSAVRLVFPDISDYCSVFLARDHVPLPKPDPSHLHLALRTMRAEPGTTLMVGDHPLDIQTGKAAGVLTAGVSSGRIPGEELRKAGADWVAANCELLIELLANEGML